MKHVKKYFSLIPYLSLSETSYWLQKSRYTILTTVKDFIDNVSIKYLSNKSTVLFWLERPHAFKFKLTRFLLFVLNEGTHYTRGRRRLRTITQFF